VTWPGPGCLKWEDPVPLGLKAGSEEAMIAIRGLTKRYGHVAAVQELSFDVHAGTMVGLLGQSSACKTTTLNILAGLSVPTSGTDAVTAVPHARLARPTHAPGFGLSETLRRLRADAPIGTLIGAQIALGALTAAVGLARQPALPNPPVAVGTVLVLPLIFQVNHSLNHGRHPDLVKRHLPRLTSGASSELV
jgi:energy-coupling factor transporter ATP-binding protein EcfA2